MKLQTLSARLERERVCQPWVKQHIVVPGMGEPRPWAKTFQAPHPPRVGSALRVPPRTRPLAGQELEMGTCEITALDRDLSHPRRAITRQTARCACRHGQAAGTARAKPACVDGNRNAGEGGIGAAPWGSHGRGGARAHGWRCGSWLAQWGWWLLWPGVGPWQSLTAPCPSLCPRSVLSTSLSHNLSMVPCARLSLWSPNRSCAG